MDDVIPCRCCGQAVLELAVSCPHCEAVLAPRPGPDPLPAPRPTEARSSTAPRWLRWGEPPPLLLVSWPALT